MQNICVESLVSAVQSRNVLWNDAHKEFKNRNITDKEWNEVGRICNCTGAAAKTKWKNLKDTYRRTLQKMPRLTSRKELQTHKIKWPYLELMSFIKKTLALDSPDLTDHNLREADESVTEMISKKRQINVESELELEFEIKKEREESHIEMEQIEKPEREKEHENEDLLFFKSLLPFFGKFNDVEKLEIRNEIQNIIIARLKNKY